MFKIRRASAIAAGAVAALAIGGTAALAAGADDPAPSPSSDDRVAVPMLPNGDPAVTASADDSASVPASAGPAFTPPAARAVPQAGSPLSISIDRAKTIAVRAAGGGRVVQVEGEFEHGLAVWDVDVLVNGVEHDIDVDRATGSVTRHRIGSTSGRTGSSGTGSSGGTGSSSTGSGRTGSDDPAGHDATDDNGGNTGGGTDDSAGHDATDDHGGALAGGTDDVNHDAGDDHGGGHGSDD
jgi:hypothetical protein